MKPRNRDENKTIFKSGWLATVTATVLLGTMLHVTPAWAVHFTSLDYLDVDCSGLRLRQATGVPNSEVHTYALGGACRFFVVDSDSKQRSKATLPVVASAHWDLASKTYSESLHLLAATTVKDLAPDGSVAKVGTYPEVASFKCDVDPVINRSAHCTLDSQYNDTGWNSPINSRFYTNRGYQEDGFAWKANHNRPLLLGLATRTQAASLSRKNKHPPISCNGLKLVSVQDLPKNGTRRYHFDGTCELYHTEDGSGGLHLTHVFVTGFWNAHGQEAQETFDVAVPGNEGGGLYRLAYYTCSANPFIHGNVQCSLEKPLNKVSPVYDPITDLRAKHPIAAGMANPAQVAKILKPGSKSQSQQRVRNTAINLHNGGTAKRAKVPAIQQAGKVRKGGTASRTSLPAVQRHAQFGGKLKNITGVKKQLPAVQTMSGHLPSGHTQKGLTRAITYKGQKTHSQPPRLKLVNNRVSVDASCANPAKFITLRETVINEGGALSAGHARIYVKESGGAHISSQSVLVPALAHGARTTLTLKAGTQAAYRGKISGRHVLSIHAMVNGHTTTSKLVSAFRPGLCQVHTRISHHPFMKGKIKLNPQPEPPSAQRK